MFLSRERVVKNEKCKFLLVKDTSDKSARHFMQALAVSCCKDQAGVKYLSYDLPRGRILSRYGNVGKDFVLHDAFSDLYSADPNPDLNVDFLSCDIFRQFRSSSASVVFIDSLFALLSENTVQSLYRSIHSFLTDSFHNAQLIALLHTDSHPENDVLLLESLATTTLELLSVSDKGHYCVQTVTKLKNGKVSRETLECCIDEAGVITTMKEIQPQLNTSVPQKRPDPTANLTFNLKLKNAEKGVREKLQLPYTQIQSDSAAISSDMFSDDFYDEEDPDDDLDI